MTTEAASGPLQEHTLATVESGCAFTTTPLRADATTLDQLREHGPFDPIFTPVLGPDHLVDAWLTPSQRQEPRNTAIRLKRYCATPF
ncbi:hypothetical protein [Kitasatospora kifunensis]|uniref:Uncharacterized protein n=1 Tax=Kitasatospora kifunensis TaxID=58351 RepID=A0A7W7RAI7_KITKI|nr:hypothetical protein [Kitasatospora kifunensis]MBB4928413.1 hypothetical protein [Kitasatospora kifunensis]